MAVAVTRTPIHKADAARSWAVYADSAAAPADARLAFEIASYQLKIGSVSLPISDAKTLAQSSRNSGKTSRFHCAAIALKLVRCRLPI